MRHPLEFRGDRAFLSNFYPAPVCGYATVEHAFQATKAAREVDRLFVASAATPGEAKRRGRRIAMRPDWPRMRVAAMDFFVREKFARHSELTTQLILVPDVVIVEWNTWHDMDWGQCTCPQHIGQQGSNYLGLILTQVRSAYLT